MHRASTFSQASSRRNGESPSPGGSLPSAGSSRRSRPKAALTLPHKAHRTPPGSPLRPGTAPTGRVRALPTHPTPPSGKRRSGVASPSPRTPKPTILKRTWTVQEQPQTPSGPQQRGQGQAGSGFNHNWHRAAKSFGWHSLGSPATPAPSTRDWLGSLAERVETTGSDSEDEAGAGKSEVELANARVRRALALSGLEGLRDIQTRVTDAVAEYETFAARTNESLQSEVTGHSAFGDSDEQRVRSIVVETKAMLEQLTATGHEEAQILESTLDRLQHLMPVDPGLMRHADVELSDQAESRMKQLVKDRRLPGSPEGLPKAASMASIAESERQSTIVLHEMRGIAKQGKIKTSSAVASLRTRTLGKMGELLRMARQQQAEAEDHRLEIAGLEKRLEEHISMVDSLQKQLAVKSMNLGRTQNELRKATGALVNLEKKLNASRKECDRLKEQLAEREKVVAQLTKTQKMHADHDTKHEGLLKEASKREVAKLKRQLQQATSAHQLADGKLAEFMDSAREVHRQLQDALHEKRILKEQLLETQQKLSQLSGQGPEVAHASAQTDIGATTLQFLSRTSGSNSPRLGRGKSFKWSSLEAAEEGGSSSSQPSSPRHGDKRAAEDRRIAADAIQQQEVAINKLQARLEEKKAELHATRDSNAENLRVMQRRVDEVEQAKERQGKEMAAKYLKDVIQPGEKWEQVYSLLQQLKSGRGNVELTQAVRERECARLDFTENKAREDFKKHNRELTSLRTAMSAALEKAEQTDITLPKRRQYTAQYNKLAKKEAKAILAAHKARVQAELIVQTRKAVVSATTPNLWAAEVMYLQQRLSSASNALQLLGSEVGEAGEDKPKAQLLRAAATLEAIVGSPSTTTSPAVSLAASPLPPSPHSTSGPAKSRSRRGSSARSRGSKDAGFRAARPEPVSTSARSSSRKGSPLTHATSSRRSSLAAGGKVATPPRTPAAAAAAVQEVDSVQAGGEGQGSSPAAAAAADGDRASSKVNTPPQPPALSGQPPAHVLQVDTKHAAEEAAALVAAKVEREPSPEPSPAGDVSPWSARPRRRSSAASHSSQVARQLQVPPSQTLEVNPGAGVRRGSHASSRRSSVEAGRPRRRSRSSTGASEPREAQQARAGAKEVRERAEAEAARIKAEAEAFAARIKAEAEAEAERVKAEAQQGKGEEEQAAKGEEERTTKKVLVPHRADIVMKVESRGGGRGVMAGSLHRVDPALDDDDDSHKPSSTPTLIIAGHTPQRPGQRKARAEEGQDAAGLPLTAQLRVEQENIARRLQQLGAQIQLEQEESEALVATATSPASQPSVSAWADEQQDYSSPRATAKGKRLARAAAKPTPGSPLARASASGNTWEEPQARPEQQQEVKEKQVEVEEGTSPHEGESKGGGDAKKEEEVVGSKSEEESESEEVQQPRGASPVREVVVRARSGEADDEEAPLSLGAFLAMYRPAYKVATTEELAQDWPEVQPSPAHHHPQPRSRRRSSPTRSRDAATSPHAAQVEYTGAYPTPPPASASPYTTPVPPRDTSPPRRRVRRDVRLSSPAQQPAAPLFDVTYAAQAGAESTVRYRPAQVEQGSPFVARMRDMHDRRMGQLVARPIASVAAARDFNVHSPARHSGMSSGPGQEQYIHKPGFLPSTSRAAEVWAPHLPFPELDLTAKRRGGEAR